MIISVSCLIFPWKMKKFGQRPFTYFPDCLFPCDRVLLVYWNLIYLTRHVVSITGGKRSFKTHFLFQMPWGNLEKSNHFPCSYSDNWKSHSRQQFISECCGLQHLELKRQLYKRISRRSVLSCNTRNAECSCQRMKTEGFSSSSSVTQTAMVEQECKLRSQCLGLYLEE